MCVNRMTVLGWLFLFFLVGNERKCVGHAPPEQSYCGTTFDDDTVTNDPRAEASETRL